MSTYNLTSKRLLASAFITTGLLGATPVISEEIILSESSSISQEKMSPRIETQLCNQQFQCSKTGYIVHFLPNSKALFIHPELPNTLHADYTVHFNRNIVLNVYENPSKHFDVMLHDIQLQHEGLVAHVNQERRYFHRV